MIDTAPASWRHGRRASARTLARVAVAVALVFQAVGARAADDEGAEVIGPGREGDVLELLAPYAPGSAVDDTWSIDAVALDRASVTVRLGDGADGGVQIVVRPVSTARFGDVRTPNFAIDAPARGRGARAAALVVDAIRRNEPAGQWWDVAAPRPNEESGTPAAQTLDGSGQGVGAIETAADRIERARCYTGAEDIPARERALPGSPWWPVLGLLLLVAARFALFAVHRRRGRSHRPRSGGNLLVAMVMSAAATMLLAELALQLARVAPPAPAVPADLERCAVDSSVNGLGLREAWDSRPPARRAGEVRVAMIGDSFTFGEAVDRAEAFPAVVERRAAERWPAVPVRVFNLGVAATGPVEQHARYEELADTLDVDVVVLVAYLNDFILANPAFTLAEIYDVAGDDDTGLASVSLLAAHVRSVYRNRVIRARSIAHYRSSALNDLSTDFRPFADEILALRDDVERRGAVLRIVFFPWIFELDDYPTPEVHAHMREFADANDIPFLDLLDVYAGRPASELRVSDANEHPSVLGHALAADAITDFLAPDLVGNGDGPER